MIIYSVEILISKDIEKKWFDWMEKKHIPDVMRTNLFLDFKFFKNILSPKNPTYTVQYRLKSIDDYLQYQDKFANNLKKEHSSKFKNQFSAKRQLLRVIEE